MSGGRVGVAEAVHRAARHHALQARNVVRAEVVKVKPLKVKPMGSTLTLDEDDFDLSQWVDYYDAQYGIDVGDTVLMMREGGEYSIFDVHADDPPALAADKKVKTSAVADRVTALEAALVALTARVTALEGP